MHSYYSDAPAAVQTALRVLQRHPAPLTPEALGTLLWAVDRAYWTTLGEGHFVQPWVLGTRGPVSAGLEALDAGMLPEAWEPWLKAARESWWPEAGVRTTAAGRQGELGSLTPRLEQQLDGLLTQNANSLQQEREAMGRQFRSMGVAVGAPIPVSALLQSVGWPADQVEAQTREYRERQAVRSRSPGR